MLPSEISKLPTDPPVERVSWCLETSPPSWLPFVLPPFKENRLPFWAHGVLPQCSYFFCGILSAFKWSCDEFVGEKVLFRRHLRTTPQRKFSSYVHIIAYINFFLVCVLRHFSHVRLFATPWTVACQAPLSMVFSRQEYWSGLPFPSPNIFSYCQVIIPFYRYITFHLFIYQLMDAWVILHMAIMKNAAKISIQVFMQTQFLLSWAYI